MLYRTEMRQKVVELLKAHIPDDQDRVYDSRVINWDAADLPGISVYTSAQRGSGYAAGQTPMFDSTLTLNIEIALAETRDWALKADNICEQIEQVLFCNAEFIQMFEYVENYNVDIGYRGGGEKPVITAIMSMEFSFKDQFKPLAPDDLERVAVDLKLP